MRNPAHSAPLNILFIGNSFTARNNLPDLIAQLAAAHGESMRHRLITAGGASLRRHWNAGEAAIAHPERPFQLRGAPGAEHVADQKSEANA